MTRVEFTMTKINKYNNKINIATKYYTFKIIISFVSVNKKIKMKL